MRGKIHGWALRSSDVASVTDLRSVGHHLSDHAEFLTWVWIEGTYMLYS